MRARVGTAVVVAALGLAAPAMAQECPEQHAAVEFALQQTLRDIPPPARLNIMPARERAAANQAKTLAGEAQRLLAVAQRYRCLEPGARDYESAIALALTRAAFAFLEGADSILADFGMMTHRY